MRVGVWILGDQLSLAQAALQSCGDIKNLPVILIESLHHVQVRPYHKQKLVLVWSAMRHFTEELRQQGYSVTYKIVEDFQTALQAWSQLPTLTFGTV